MRAAAIALRRVAGAYCVVVLGWAGVFKVYDPSQFAVSLSARTGADFGLAFCLGCAIGAAEVIGVVLIVAAPTWRRAGCLIAFGLSLLFVVVALLDVVGDSETPCGCFGPFIELSSPIRLVVAILL